MATTPTPAPPSSSGKSLEKMPHDDLQDPASVISHLRTILCDLKTSIRSPQYADAAEEQIDKLINALSYVEKALEWQKIFDSTSKLLKDLTTHAGELPKLNLTPKTVSEEVGGGSGSGGGFRHVLSWLSLLSEIIAKLKLQIPCSSYDESTAKAKIQRAWTTKFEKGKDESPAAEDDPLRSLYRDQNFRTSEAYTKFISRYNALDLQLRLCLLSMAVFPECYVFKKRLMSHWWTGEGLLDQLMPEGIYIKKAGGILNKLAENGFILPLNRKLGRKPRSYLMPPLMHSMVVMVASEAKFFDFDDKGDLRPMFTGSESSPRACFDFDDDGKPTFSSSKSPRACLVKSSGLDGSTSSSSCDPFAYYKDQDDDFEKLQTDYFDKLHTVFNVNETLLNFKKESLLKMKNLTVLSLGSWQGTSKHHIEVESMDFLEGLSGMKYLKFLSLQGISRITKLPDSITKLLKLRVLDLRDCHNLESLPEQISSLRELTHLDMSGCYLLEHMPKGIRLLSKLEVLRGFIVRDPRSRRYCTLEDLTRLQNLRELDVITSRREFPVRLELNALQELKCLRKLTILWGGKSYKEQSSSSPSQEKERHSKFAGCHPFSRCAHQRSRVEREEGGRVKVELKALEKLDLQCYPGENSPAWLIPENFQQLKSLYIRGGKLQTLPQPSEGELKWKVKVLILKYLNGLKMNWIELRKLFPDLTCFKKYNCPELVLFPCNESGVWLSYQRSTDSKNL